MKILILFTLFVLVSCDGIGSKKSTSKKLPGLPETIKIGETTSKDVESELGTPENSYEIKDASVNTYKDGSAVKIEKDIVQSYFRDPVGDEAKLQYWLQQWKDKITTSEKIETSKDEHGKFEYQLINKADNITIIFDNETGTVKRIMHYEN